jgi:hypothetical protein
VLVAGPHPVDLEDRQAAECHRTSPGVELPSAGGGDSDEGFGAERAGRGEGPREVGPVGVNPVEVQFARLEPGWQCCGRSSGAGCGGRGGGHGAELQGDTGGPELVDPPFTRKHLPELEDCPELVAFELTERSGPKPRKASEWTEPPVQRSGV